MLRIKALGSLAVVGEAGPIAGAAAQPKRAAILALLARSGERPITRDKILGLLWTDADEDRSRRALANSLTALRRDLGADDVFLGGSDLRLNLEVATADVIEFEKAARAGELTRAAALYEGPFLDGFRVAGAPEFDRWMDAERSALAHTYATLVERLALAAEQVGDMSSAVGWWRKLASNDPLNARNALGLMRALAATGDSPSALRHAQIYEALIEQELELPADREVAAFAQRLRQEQSRAAATPIDAASPPQTAESAPGTAQLRPEQACVAQPLSPGRAGVGSTARRWALTGGLAVALVVGLVWFKPGGPVQPVASASVLAVGRIADYRRESGGELARPLGDMLATNLARTSTIRVVSTARMYELLARSAGTDTSESATVSAARAGGATLLVDGALHAVQGGALRLDVQVVDLATGSVFVAHTVTGNDPLALADSATARLVESLGMTAPAGSVADVTTRSVSAYRLYEQGLRAYFAGAKVSARRLFAGALAEDSTFAMAAYYLARSSDSWAMSVRLAERARQLAVNTTDRERLKIEAWYAEQVSADAYPAIAETLAVRYPHDVDGALNLGRATLADNRPVEAIRILERVVATDSLIARDDPLPCSSCEALELIVHGYQAMDSLPAAIRTIDRWARLKPQSRAAWQARAATLTVLGRHEEAMEAFARYVSVSEEPGAGQLLLAQLHILGERFDDADRLLRELAAAGPLSRRAAALWYLSLSLRHQGKLERALVAAREHRRVSTLADSNSDASLLSAPPEAQVLFELGRYGEAAALFDSLSRIRVPGSTGAAGATARARVWWLTHLAGSRAAMGDTASLEGIADTVEARGPGSMLHRDRRLHFHVRGLLLAARGRTADAVAQFEQSRFSRGAAFTRTNYELARLYLTLGRAHDAVAVLQPVLRGGLEGSSFFLTRTEVHDILARSWEAVAGASARDSAVAHYRRVVEAWSSGDETFAARARHSRARIAAIARR